MSSKGQIVVPKEIRESLHLKEGVKFQVLVRGNDIVFSRAPDWRTLYEGIEPASVSMTQALLDERALDREREDRR
jgi:AbrB family looped-hinge helix DNA binding protein